MGYPQESEDLSEQLPSIHIHSKFKKVFQCYVRLPKVLLPPHHQQQPNFPATCRLSCTSKALKAAHRTSSCCHCTFENCHCHGYESKPKGALVNIMIQPSTILLHEFLLNRKEHSWPLSFFCANRFLMKVIQNQLCTELLPHFSATSRLTRSPIPAAQNSV